MINHDTFREIACFGAIGLLATAVHYVVALLAIESLSMSVYVGNFAGYVTAVGVSFVGHGKLTFRATLNHGVFRRFLLISITTFFASELLLVGLEEYLKLSHRVAMIVVVFSIPMISFVLSKYWVYNSQSQPD